MASRIVQGEVARSERGDRSRPMAIKPPRSGDEMMIYAANCDRLQGMVRRAEDVAGSSPPYEGTAETEEESDPFLANSGEGIQLFHDTGHMAMAGGDALRANLISHVHTREMRQPPFDALDRNRESIQDAVLHGTFTIPGDGSLDFVAIAQRLVDHGHEGWFAVDAEQDPRDGAPAVDLGQGQRRIVPHPGQDRSRIGPSRRRGSLSGGEAFACCRSSGQTPPRRFRVEPDARSFGTGAHEGRPAGIHRATTANVG